MEDPQQDVYGSEQIGDENNRELFIRIVQKVENLANSLMEDFDLFQVWSTASQKFIEKLEGQYGSDAINRSAAVRGLRMTTAGPELTEGDLGDGEVEKFVDEAVLAFGLNQQDKVDAFLSKWDIAEA